ncbi:hypothetical protein PFISCL1PPCAC_11790, partial [Pristionchus fissidentatus]
FLQEDDDSFMIINLDEVHERVKLWKRELPQVEPFYAVKCNPDEAILRSLAALGAGFDCASRAEIDMVLRLGVAPERIVYANTIKTRGYIAHADAVGVNMMTFDNEEELEKIAAYHKHPELILRIIASDPTAINPLSTKFGADPVRRAILLRNLKFLWGAELTFVPYSFHVGSGCNDPSAFRAALEHTRTLFELGRALGHKMEIVDVGGGFPGGEHHIPFEKV